MSSWPGPFSGGFPRLRFEERVLIRVHQKERFEGGDEAGVFRVRYGLKEKGPEDRVLFVPSEEPVWWVVLHGHGSCEDQLFTRRDLKEGWWPAFRETGGGILSPNLLGNLWMSPLAVNHLRALLEWVRVEFGVRQFLFLGGSMGGTGVLFYSLQHPEDVAGAIVLGAVPAAAQYVRWGRAFPFGTIQRQIAETIETAYGGPPEREPQVYADRDARTRVDRLPSLLFLAHGTDDRLMPVDWMRELAVVLHPGGSQTFHEIAGGHDAPLALATEAVEWLWSMTNEKGEG